MNKNKIRPKIDDAERWHRKQMRDPEFRRMYNEGKPIFDVSYRILCLREDAGLTQAQLAKRVGVTQSFIAQLESADKENIELKTLVKISLALGKDIIIDFVDKSKAKRKTKQIKGLAAAA